MGDFEGCDARGHDFPNVVHVWSDLNRTEGRVCRCVSGPVPIGFPVRWSEGERLSAMSIPVDVVVAYMRKPGDLLIHCAGGACRSPVLAVLAMVARGDNVWGAIGHVFRRTWEGRGFTPTLPQESMAGIVKFWEAGRP